MIEELNQSILNALKNNIRTPNPYSVYAFTNECISKYLKGITGFSALSICSSGDQYLNLIYQDFKRINLIDINPLANYYALGIKEALILAFSYEDFKKVITFLFKSNKNNFKLEEQIFNLILKHMLPPYQAFWKPIFKYYTTLQSVYKKDITLFQIITKDSYFSLEEITYYNYYLQTESIYNYIKQNLLKINKSFVLTDLLEYKTNEKYDLILCSNILEYQYLPDINIIGLKKLFEPLKSNLTAKGQIYAAYMYNLYQDGEIRNFPIGGLNITSRELLREKLLLVPSYKKRSENGILIL